jgi:hypothetical protein
MNDAKDSKIKFIVTNSFEILVSGTKKQLGLKEGLNEIVITIGGFTSNINVLQL